MKVGTLVRPNGFAPFDNPPIEGELGVITHEFEPRVIKEPLLYEVKMLSTGKRYLLFSNEFEEANDG